MENKHTLEFKETPLSSKRIKVIHFPNPPRYTYPEEDVKEAVERLKDKVYGIDLEIEGQGIIVDECLREIENIFGRFDDG